MERLLGLGTIGVREAIVVHIDAEDLTLAVCVDHQLDRWDWLGLLLLLLLLLVDLGLVERVRRVD